MHRHGNIRRVVSEELRSLCVTCELQLTSKEEGRRLQRNAGAAQPLSDAYRRCQSRLGEPLAATGAEARRCTFAGRSSAPGEV